MLYLVGQGENLEQISEQILALSSSLEAGSSLLLGWSEPQQQLTELSFAYEEAEHALQSQIAHNNNSIVHRTEKLNTDKLKVELRETLQYLKEHFQEEISLQEIAASVHMSESSFSRLFKKQIGVSFVEYVTQLRIEKAMKMLERPDEKIYEVAATVGYQDSRYFSQIFRKYTGETPSEFRKRIGIG